MQRNWVLAAGAAAGSVAGLAALAGRYVAGVARADRAWPPQAEAGLRGLGEVDEVSILPVVQRLTADGGSPECPTWSARAAPGCCLTRACPAGSPNRRWRATPGRWARACRIWTRW